MNALNLYYGNRLEDLVKYLAEMIKTPLQSPFAEEFILVQSKGMEKWISINLAKINGICANTRFPFPNAFILDYLSSLTSDISQSEIFEPVIMTFRIMKELEKLVAEPEFKKIHDYLALRKSDLALYQLSGRIADVFDQYLVYRPDMILNWDKGKGKIWQARLWREITKNAPGRHRVSLIQNFFNRLETSPDLQKNLPERISVFGISTLPPFHLEVLHQLSKYRPVNLFLMNPCRHYWGDIRDKREKRILKSRYNKKNGNEKPDETDLHMESGNRLLSSMGILGRDFFDRLFDYNVNEFSLFTEPGQDTLLRSIQTDILDLTEPEAENLFQTNDGSIQVHSCHSPMREVEILHDRLLDMFENDPLLKPEDILVMVPDMEVYAPCIEGIFGPPGDDPGQIPFSITDRKPATQNPLMETFIQLFDLSRERFSVSRVFSLLENPWIHKKFNLTFADLTTVFKWLQETRIRWGIDEKSRKQQGLPPFEENTWKAGLSRLLLGYALPGQETRLFENILPYDPVEGNRAQILGELVEFFDRLLSAASIMEKKQSLGRWAKSLLDVVNNLFDINPDTEENIVSLKNVLVEMEKLEEKTGYDQKVTADVVRSHILDRYGQKGHAAGFLNGKVTFCVLVPMRSVPFSVICMLGMNHNDYPRQSKAYGFDLMARFPRSGDRSRRNDERYLFLESIVSARDILYISYVGQCIRDNTPIPPSVLVSELLDYIRNAYGTKESEIVIEHRLQPFSPAYFEKDAGTPLFSYSRDNCEAARRVSETPESPPPFITQGLSPPDPESQLYTVTPGDLARFFIHPARFLLQKRLRIFLEEENAVLEENENFHLKDPTLLFPFRKRLLESLLAEETPDFIYLREKAAGNLPPETVGEYFFQKEAGEASKFIEEMKPLISKTPEFADIDIDIENCRIAGRIYPLYNGRLVRYRYWNINPKEWIRTWITHLVLNLSPENKTPKESYLIGLEKDEYMQYKILPPENPENILQDLVKLYKEGLQKPLLFFPETSWGYAFWLLTKKKEESESFEKAIKFWEGNPYKPGEAEDPYNRLCFNDRQFKKIRFQEIAARFFGPLFDHKNE